METAQFFEKRAADANADVAQQAWDKIGSVNPVPKDTWTKP
jgi:hypothetical protein